MPTTPGHRRLLGAIDEADAVRSVVEYRWRVKTLVCPSASQVLEEIPNFDVVHFACHGSSERADPLQSHLLLQKEDEEGERAVDRLTVSALLDANA